MNFKFGQSRPVRPDQVNEHNQITDKKILNRDRLKFGVGAVMYQGQENALIPIHTAVIRALGGTDIHLGAIAAVLTSSGAMMQWFGALLLRWVGSNKKALCIAISGGIVFGSLLVATLLTAAVFPARTGICLILYILFYAGLSCKSGVQGNIETGWIGDLVPGSLRGWFTSVKMAISTLGVLTLTLIFGQVTAHSPKLTTYAGIFLLIPLTHIAAILLMSTVTDRRSSPAVFFGRKDDPDRLNYRNGSLWSYIWFYVCWAGGRTALTAFSTAYMLDHLHFTMNKIVMVFAITNLINLIMLLTMGKVSDRVGTRLLLTIISGGMSLCMLLWVASAWWGIWPIILYQFINGTAGTTHAMLSTNYGLEIFPRKGRAGYFAVARLFIGCSTMAAAVSAGMIMSRLRGWHMLLWGREFNHYHIFFLGCALFTAGCVIPLLMKAGSQKRKQTDQQQLCAG